MINFETVSKQFSNALIDYYNQHIHEPPHVASPVASSVTEFTTFNKVFTGVGKMRKKGLDTSVDDNMNANGSNGRKRQVKPSSLSIETD